MWAEEPSEEEEAHSGYDKGAGNRTVEPSCEVESQQRTKEGVDDGEPHTVIKSPDVQKVYMGISVE